jgi:hypothetical protein
VTARYEAAVGFRTSDSPDELLEYAAALCDLIDRNGQGRPSDLVAAGRRAHRADERAVDALYWEARGHLFAGRPVQAHRLLTQFIDEAKPHRQATRRLVDDARRRLVAIADDRAVKG